MNEEPLFAANVSSVPHRSPFRYPGGKSWLVPQIRQWLKSIKGKRVQLIEPFAGGASVALTAVMEELVYSATLVELDKDVAAVWRVILGRDGHRLKKLIRDSNFVDSEIIQLLETKPNKLFDRAVQTLLRNRVARNGILADGAGLLKNGESGQGLKSRWYPETIARRIQDIIKVKDRLRIKNADGLEVIVKNRHNPNLVFFVDPPYMGIAQRLYRHGVIDHAMLFQALSDVMGDFLITYNDDNNVRSLAESHGLSIRTITMRCGHNRTKDELLIGRNLSWLNGERSLTIQNTSKTVGRGLSKPRPRVDVATEIVRHYGT